MAEARTKTKAPAPRRAPVVPVRRMDPRAVLSPALRVGAVNDPAEREAETMAARVVGASAPVLAAPVADAPTAPQAAPLRRSEDQPNTDDLAPEPVPGEQADFDLPSTQDVNTDGLSNTETNELDAGAPVDTGGSAPNPEGDVSAARPDGATVGRMGGLAPSDVTQRVANPGPGRPLPAGLRARVEPHFGTSFEDVRLHTTKSDQEAATRIGARAFTHKHHIWLGPGETETNTRLMAHELTHVVQQTRGSDALPINGASPARRTETDEAQRAETPTIRRAGWLVNKAESAARHVPGYTLITVIVGRKLISGDKVAMTGKNLLGGLFGLLPGGTAIFDQLEQAGVIDKAFEWVKKQLTELNLTWSRIQNTLEELYDGLISFSPVANAKRILGGLVSDILTFVKRITVKVLEFVIQGALKLAGPYADKVWGILKQAGEVIGDIVKDPLGFALNLVKSVVGGFLKFGANILKHLKAGILGWLFGALTSAGLELPAKLDFKGLMSIVMQVLGLTYANFRARLVKQLGPSGEKKVAMIEKSVEIVKVLLKEGFAGIWKKMLEMIENFKETLLGGMSDMVITTVIKAGLSWLAGLSNPVGAVIKVVLGIYDLIVAFLERLDQIMDVAKSIFSSIGAIAKGQVQKAIDFVEATIGKSVPVVISFLAAALGLGGITSKIKGVIKKLQAPVTKAMDKLIKFVIKKGKKLFSKLLKKLNGKRKLPAGAFKIGKENHTLFAAQKDKRKIVIKIASTPSTAEETQACTKKEIAKKPEGAKPSANPAGPEMNNALSKTVKDTTDDENRVDLASEKKSQLVHLTDLQKEIDRLTKVLNDAGAAVEKDPNLTPAGHDDACLVRNKTERDPTFEGQAMLYSELQDAAKKEIKPGVTRGSVYDLDHTIEKQYAKALLKNIHLFDQDNPDASKAKAGTAGNKKGDEKVYRDPGATNAMGQLGKKDASREAITGKATNKSTDKADLSEIDASGSNLPAVAIFNRTHVQKAQQDPVALVKEALGEATKEARQNKLADLLIAQLDHEVRLMMEKANGDESSNADLRGKVKAGLNEARAMNAKLFNFGNKTSAEPGDVNQAESKIAPEDKMLSPKVNFTADEGKGGKYAGATHSVKNQIDSDHVVDKVLPLTAKEEVIADAATRAEIAKEAADEGEELTSSQKGRLNQLSHKLYKGRAMADYTEYKGYAIRVTTAIHRQITPGTRQNAATVQSKFKQARDAAKADMVDYVKTGDTKIASIKETLRDAPKSYFQQQSVDHEDALAQAYNKEVQRVVDLHPAAQQGAAKTAMQGIKLRVFQSLQKSNQLTENLFGGKGAYSAE
ncbi:eCIS core domain-containing protein [Shimia ponticola]|uniref:eCIS core domain-containing protein n=1 Tax=Shimia ponticola TaxID=2582893 RepID=UPI0011BF932D|nr:DUF4157 domain-containing protein [Shimia ponticola]